MLPPADDFGDGVYEDAGRVYTIKDGSWVEIVGGRPYWEISENGDGVSITVSDGEGGVTVQLTESQTRSAILKMRDAIE